MLKRLEFCQSWYIILKNFLKNKEYVIKTFVLFEMIIRFVSFKTYACHLDLYFSIF